MDIEKKPSMTSAAVETEHGCQPPTPELRHNFSVWSLASLCLCLMATWEALTSVVAAALTNGGAPCLFYNYILSFLGSIAIAASLAEIASIYPTAGGQYHWVALMAPRSSSIAPSWFTAWISIGGQIVLTASAAFAAALQLQALITVNHPDSYVPQRWQGMLFYWLILLYACALNIWGSKILPQSNMAAGVLHIGGFVALIVLLGVMAPKHTAEYVFVETSNQSGWASDGVSWLVGLVSAVYPFLGYDAATHLAEEMDNPARNVPIAMVGSTIVNGVMGLAYCLVLLFSLGDLDSLLTSPTGFPFIQLFQNVTNSTAGTTVITLIISMTAINGNAAGLTSTSRTAWSFARDNGLPFSGFFAHIDNKLSVPSRMIVLVTVLQMILGFLYLGSSTAFNAVLSMAIIGMYASYVLPIAYMLIYGRDGSHKSGPFALGSWMGQLTNVVALIWATVAIVFSTFPSIQPVTAQNMNYSVVVMGGWLLFGAAYFVFAGKKSYNGPLIELVGVERVSED